MDAHCKNCFVVAMDPRGKVKMRVKLQTTERVLINFIRSIAGKKALTFEESTISQWLYVLLKDEVDHLIVCDPAANIKGAGAKTDFADATELADLLRVGRLSPVFHAADERMELRTLISGYDDLVQEIVRTKNRYKAVFRQSAIRLKGNCGYSDVSRQKELVNESQKLVVRSLFEQIQMLGEQKKNYLKRFRQNMKRFKEMRLIKSIPGFDTIRANQIVGTIVSPYRFANKYHLFSYAMLVKHKQVSDGVVYGKKSAYGKTQLKGIFKMSARQVIQKNNAFRRKYEQMLAAGCDAQAARNAVARALAATVLGVWKRGKKYNDRYREVMSGKNSCDKRD
jgi:transposase